MTILLRIVQIHETLAYPIIALKKLILIHFYRAGICIDGQQ